MTKTMQTVRYAAPFLVSVAGVTLASPALTEVKMPRGSLDMGHSDLASPSAASAMEGHADRLASEISSSYASQLKDAYTRIDLGQNPALAALAANLAQLAQQAQTR